MDTQLKAVFSTLQSTYEQYSASSEKEMEELERLFKKKKRNLLTKLKNKKIQKEQIKKFRDDMVNYLNEVINKKYQRLDAWTNSFLESRKIRESSRKRNIADNDSQVETGKRQKLIPVDEIVEIDDKLVMENSENCQNMGNCEVVLQKLPNEFLLLNEKVGYIEEKKEEPLKVSIQSEELVTAMSNSTVIFPELIPQVNFMKEPVMVIKKTAKKQQNQQQPFCTPSNKAVVQITNKALPISKPLSSFTSTKTPKHDLFKSAHYKKISQEASSKKSNSSNTSKSSFGSTVKQSTMTATKFQPIKKAQIASARKQQHDQIAAGLQQISQCRWPATSTMHQDETANRIVVAKPQISTTIAKSAIQKPFSELKNRENVPSKHQIPIKTAVSKFKTTPIVKQQQNQKLPSSKAAAPICTPKTQALQPHNESLRRPPLFAQPPTPYLKRRTTMLSDECKALVNNHQSVDIGGFTTDSEDEDKFRPNFLPAWCDKRGGVLENLHRYHTKHTDAAKIFCHPSFIEMNLQTMFQSSDKSISNTVRCQSNDAGDSNHYQ